MFSSLELLLKALDKAIQLLALRSENRHKMFKEVVAPLVKDLEPVISDYRAFFERSIEKIKETDAGDLAPIVEELQRLREQMLPARIKLQQLADAIETSAGNDRHLKDFARNVLAIFYCTRHKQVVKMSRTIEYIEFLEHLPSDSARRRKSYLVDATRRTKAEIDHSWELVSKTYGMLLIQSVK